MYLTEYTKEGLLCSDSMFTISWPSTVEDCDFITNLRNRPNIRKFFLNSNLLDLQENRAYLLNKMERSHEGVFIVKHKLSAIPIGMLGWSDLNQEENSIQVGRLAFDIKSIILLRKNFHEIPTDIPAHCTSFFRNFIFTDLGIINLYSFYIIGNALSQELMRKIGFENIKKEYLLTSCNKQVLVMKCVIKSSRWKRLIQ